MIRYNAMFEKKGDIRYISHLDLMTVLRRAIRRSGLPFVTTAGFTPRVKISIPMALKLGKESVDEQMSFWLMEKVELDKAVKAINNNLPKGVKILKVNGS
ncbi:MAG: TIGR03936 family radical SAM-associated protein [Candidatus Omnitrophota bacterium]